MAWAVAREAKEIKETKRTRKPRQRPPKVRGAGDLGIDFGILGPGPALGTQDGAAEEGKRWPG